MPNFIPITELVQVLGKPSSKAVSGTITVETVDKSRGVSMIRNGDWSKILTTVSDSVDGTYSLDMTINHNDSVTVIHHGRTGEFSKIFDDVKE